MKYNDKTDHLVFENGKEIYAHNGIIGIDEELTISEGYDGGIEEMDLTGNEKVELADYAIALWEKYRSSEFKNI